ncbi:SMI1/KNR4 family protein [Chitinophaga sp. CF418]|uniref:SMI1/KNR4 family protein n=1 Tax=Chitinophaga sp. CF418 TaxID=1855287 RepID=UPI0009244714|nr:SMI1/KNR4 family protein [Chitinophaga sp. CF418]SHN45477.1 SMI1 / KNR4 family (SUKH-1) [Chitinophaga sp. CF418]
MSVTPVLKKLEQFFSDQQSIVYPLLLDGISRAEIDEKKKALNLSFPPEVYELFEWKNGIKDSDNLTIGQCRLFPWGILESFDGLLGVYKFSTTKKYFSDIYFPILTSGGGDYILINCNEDDEFYGYVYWYSPALYGTELDLRFNSLHTYLQCVLECFEAGAYLFEGGVFEERAELADTILTKYMIPEV